MTITVHIDEDAYEGTVSQISKLPGVRAVEEDAEKPAGGEDVPPYTKAELVADLKEAFREIREIEAGRSKARPIKELLDEL